MRRRWIPALHDPAVAARVALGLEDREIALALGFDINTVSEHRSALGLQSNRRPTRPAHVAGPERDRPLPKERPNPLAIAKNWLGGRLVEKPGSGYWLDDRPVNLADIMRAANRLLAGAGAEQVGPDRWRFP